MSIVARTLEFKESKLHRRGEAHLACKVVKELLHELKDKGHYLIMNNFFFLAHLFKDLLPRNIYAMGNKLHVNGFGAQLISIMHSMHGIFVCVSYICYIL